MAFNTLEYLEAGNVDFVHRLTDYDYKNLINYVSNSDRRINIINGFLPKLKDTKPHFCFEIIYDIDEFENDAIYILNTYYNLESFTKEQLENIINNTIYGFSYLEKHFTEIINKYSKDMNFILKYLFYNLDKSIELLKQLSIHPNLHTRFLFMKYLLTNHSQYINLFYDDITKYLTSETLQEFEQISFFKDYMEMPEVCELAYICFENNNYHTWEKFKEFILQNYQYNELAYHLLNYKKDYISEKSYYLVENKNGIAEFNKDPDTLFSTSLNYRLNILNRYAEKVSEELLSAYSQQLIYFQNEGKLDEVYKKIEIYGLSRNLSAYVDKYLSISNNHTYEFLKEGSTASCYRLGDYVFKLVRTKWSYEENLCPNLYLILPNLEENFIREDRGIVLAGIEVQKYLARSAKNIPKEIFSYFVEELKRLGYYSTDTLINGPCGDNCKLLDSYLDSGNLNPPEWFKEYPLVLIDRDRIYKTDNPYPRQLRQDY